MSRGQVDELLLHLVPVLLGRGTRLFAANGTPKELELQSFADAGDVAGLVYRVIPAACGDAAATGSASRSRAGLSGS